MSIRLDDVDVPVGLARARADRIRAGIREYVRTLGDIADAYAERDWEKLGYQDWAAYVEAEFGEARLRLAPDERQRAVEALRGAARMSQRAIAVVLGVDQATVSRDLRELAAAGDADASPEPVAGLDGKTYTPRPAQIIDQDGDCGRCGQTVPMQDLAVPEAVGRCADCRREPPEHYATSIQPTIALLPGDYVKALIGESDDVDVWGLVAKVAISHKGKTSTGFVWLHGHEEPWEWPGRAEHAARRVPGRTAAAGGVTACARCHLQVPVAITYNDKCPGCLDQRDQMQRLEENLAAQAADLVPGPEQTLPAARARVGDLIWGGPGGWEQVTAAQIDAEPAEPGAWQVKLRTRLPGGPGRNWQCLWDEPQQIRRPVPGEEPTIATPPADGDPDDAEHGDEDDAEPAPAGVSAPDPPPARLTAEQIARLRAVLPAARAHGWIRTDARQWERPFTSPARHFADVTRVQLTWDAGGDCLYLSYTSDRYQKWEDALTPVDVDQALDVLAALRLLPAEVSSLHQSGRS